jgi:hypothetical protein
VSATSCSASETSLTAALAPSSSSAKGPRLEVAIDEIHSLCHANFCHCSPMAPSLANHEEHRSEPRYHFSVRILRPPVHATCCCGVLATIREDGLIADSEAGLHR